MDQDFNIKSNRKESGNSLEHIATEDNFLNRIPIMQSLRSKINKSDLMKLKKLLEGKGHHQSDKWQLTHWAKLLQTPHLVED